VVYILLRYRHFPLAPKPTSCLRPGAASESLAEHGRAHDAVLRASGIELPDGVRPAKRFPC
jgi:hypothetical protein